MKTVIEIMLRIIGAIVGCVLLAIEWGLMLVGFTIAVIAGLIGGPAAFISPNIYDASIELISKLIHLMGFVEKENE